MPNTPLFLLGTGRLADQRNALPGPGALRS